MKEEIKKKCYEITKDRLENIFEKYDKEDMMYDTVNIGKKEYVRVYCPGRKKADDPKTLGNVRFYIDIETEEIFKEDYQFKH